MAIFLKMHKNALILSNSEIYISISISLCIVDGPCEDLVEVQKWFMCHRSKVKYGQFSKNLENTIFHYSSREI